MSQQWYISRSGSQEGPFTSSQLKELVKAKEVRQDTLVWTEGMAGWTTAESVNGLFQVIPPPIAIPPDPFLDLNALHTIRARKIRHPSQTRKRNNAYLLTCAGVFLPIVAAGFAIFFISRFTNDGIGNAFSIQSAPTMTKEQFRAKFADLDGGSRSRGQVREVDLIRAVGKPSRTQTLVNRTFWYWTCQDGIIQIVIFGYKDPMVESQSGEGILNVEEVNDY